jgi:hypothetical protein
VESLELPKRDAIIYSEKTTGADPAAEKHNNTMSNPPSDYGSDPESSPDFADFDKAPEARRTGQRYARENPLPLIMLALVLGALIGAFLSRRERKQKDAVQAAKEWLETAYGQLAEKLPQLAEKLPQPKKASKSWCQAAFLDQAQQVGTKLKWW